LGGHLGYVLNQTLGLRFQDSLYFNWGGKQEIWLQSKQNDWYYITPDGHLVLWNHALVGPLTGTLTAVLDPIYYYHPDLLYQPPASDLAYAIQHELNLTFTGNLWLNWGGKNEEWLLGNDGWYFIEPDGSFWKSDGTPNKASGTLMASLNPDYYTNIQRLYNAKLTPAEVAVGLVGNSLTLTPANGFIGDFWIAVQATDVSQTVTKLLDLTVT
jgi:hypothetical protein